MTVLFVCEGNKMRSQIAEAFYNQLTGTVGALSAGAIADEGTDISVRCIEVMNEVGVDISAAHSRRLTQEMIKAADRVILFPTDFMPEYATQSSKAEVWDVADPHYNKDKGMAFVRQVRDDIHHRVQELINQETSK